MENVNFMEVEDAFLTKPNKGRSIKHNINDTGYPSDDVTGAENAWCMDPDGP